MSEVQRKLELETEEKEAAAEEPQQWKEVVDDIWKEHLPHFRGVLEGDGTFLFDASTFMYGFQYGSMGEGEDDLMGEGMDEEEAEEDKEFVEVPEEEEEVVPSLASRKDDECEPTIHTCHVYTPYLLRNCIYIVHNFMHV